MIGENISAYVLSNDVGKASRGDDLSGSLLININSSFASTSMKLSIGCPMNCLLGNRSHSIDLTADVMMENIKNFTHGHS